MPDTLPPALFERADESDDAEFYRFPRLVVHLDAATLAALTGYYREVLPPGAGLLDLMSSCASHLPDDVAFSEVVGLGMNAEELAANPRLTERRVQDLNRDPALPYAGGRFAAVLVAVSIQYLVRPVEVFREIARLLGPGGQVIVSMSHRCFPTKAIRGFQIASPAERVRLVATYLRLAGGFAPPRFADRSSPGADPLWIVAAAASGRPATAPASRSRRRR